MTMRWPSASRRHVCWRKCETCWELAFFGHFEASKFSRLFNNGWINGGCACLLNNYWHHRQPSQYLWLGRIFRTVCISLEVWFSWNNPKLDVNVNLLIHICNMYGTFSREELNSFAEADEVVVPAVVTSVFPLLFWCLTGQWKGAVSSVGVPLCPLQLPCSHLLLIVAGAASVPPKPVVTLLRGGGIRDAQFRDRGSHEQHVTLPPSD